MATATLNLPAVDRDLLALLDRAPAHLPLNSKTVHQRLTGTRGTPVAQDRTRQLLDQLAVNGLVTRTSGYMGTPGKFYQITDRGVSALHS